MNQSQLIQIQLPDGGTVIDLTNMDPVKREHFAEKTFRFVRRVMRNPEYRELIQKRAAEIRENGLYA